MEEANTRPAKKARSPERFELKAAPIAIALIACVGLYLLSLFTVAVFEHFVHLPERPEMPWIVEYYNHFFELAYVLLAIRWLATRNRGDYGLREPEGKSYVREAVLWGLAFGVLMALVDYAPQIFSLKPPADRPYPLTVFNIAGWFSFEGLFAGPSEEIFFRGLLLTYLTQAMPGRISYRGYEMNGAGVVVAVIYALASASFLGKPFAIALGQIVYAFGAGILYAYWCEKSKSLLAPVIGHSVSNLVEYVLIFAMVAGFR